MSGTKEAEVLERLGLSEGEAEVYTILIKKNVRTAEEVVAYTEKERGDINSALESLATKKYVVKVPGKKDPEHALYLAVNPQIAVTAKAEEKLRTDLSALSNEVEATWKTGVEQLYSTTRALYDETKKETDKLTNEMKGSFQSTKENFNKESGTLKKSISDLLKEQQQFFGEMISNQYTDFKTKTEEAKNAYIDVLDRETEEVLSKANALELEVSNSLNQMREDRKKSIKEYTENVQTQIRPAAEKILSSVVEARKATSDTINNAFSAIDAQQKVMRERIDAQGKGAVDIIAKRVDGLGSTIKKRGDKSFEETEKLLTKSIEITTTTLDDSSNKAVEALGSVKEKLQADIDGGRVCYQKTTESTTKLKEDLTQALTEGNNDLSLIDGHAKDVDSRLTEGTNEVKATMDEAKTQFEELFQRLEELNKSHINQHQENLLEQSAQGTKDHLDNLSTNLTANISDVIGTVKTNVEQSLQKFIDTMQRLKQVTTTNLETLSGSGGMLLGQLQTSMQEDGRAFVSDILSEIDTKVTDYDTEKIPALQKRIEETITRINRKITDGLSHSSKVLTSSSNDNERAMSNGRDEIRNYLEEMIPKYRDDITKILEEISKDKERSNQALRDDVPEDIEEFVGDHKQSMADLNRGLHTDLADLMDHVEILDREIQGDKKTRQYFKKLDFQKDKQDEFLKTLQRIRDNVTQTKGKIDGLVGDYVSELDTRFDEFRDRFDKHVSENTRTVQKLLSEQITQIGRLSNEVRDKTLEMTDGTLKKVTEETTERNERINNELTDVEKTLTGAVKDISDAQKSLAESVNYEVKQFAESMKKSSETRNKNFEEVINTNIETIQGAFNSVATQTSEDTSAQIDEIAETVENFISSIKATAEGKSDISSAQITDAVKTHIENMNAVMTEVSNETKGQLSTSFQSERDAFITNFTEIVNSKKKHFNSLTSQASKDVTDRNQKLKESLSNRLKARQTEVDTTIEKDLKDLDDYLNQQLLTSLWDTVSQIDDTSEKIVNAISLAKKDVDKALDSLAGIRETLSLLDSVIVEAKGEAVADMSKSLDESKQVNFEEITKQTEVVKAEIKKHLDDVINRFDNFENQLGKTREVLDSNLVQLNQEHLVTHDSQTEHFLRLVKTFTTKPGSALRDKASDTKTEIDEIISTKQLSLRESMDQAIISIRAQLEKIEADYAAHVDQFVTTQGKGFTELENGIITGLNDISSDKKHKTEQTQEEIKTKIESSIGTIPDTVRGALEKAGDVMKFIGDVHDVAMKTPPKPIEHSYLVLDKEAVHSAIGGAIQRTKSTISIIVPKISAFPIEALEAASKEVRFARIRISVIAGIDDESMVGKLRQIKDNIDIRDYDSGTYGFFRDVPEEGGIGSEEAGATEFIVTSSSELVTRLNEIFQNIFPRAKRV
ncbi:MAG: helix-turn-helix domain-containing protein [Promethearchaeota archaeon]